MWSPEQRQRMYLEHQVLQNEGFDQFSVCYDRGTDTYWGAGMATTNSGRQYRLYVSLPPGYPLERPSMYVREPSPLLMHDGTALTSIGVTHHMHTLAPHAHGWPQICHWRESRWHSGIMLHKVFLKGDRKSVV